MQLTHMHPFFDTNTSEARTSRSDSASVRSTAVHTTTVHSATAHSTTIGQQAIAQTPRSKQQPQLGNQNLITVTTSTEFLEQHALVEMLAQEFKMEISNLNGNAEILANRIAAEVDRVCQKSGRIQESGQAQSWQISLARHRLQKCLTYYQLGSRRGRGELHTTLGSMVYRYVAPSRMQLGFQARFNLIEDFLQGFYTESLKAFRRENELPENYQPRTRLELAEYMAFTEQYAKRRIGLPGGQTQQLIVLRAQRFGQRQPLEVSVDIEQALEYPKGKDAKAYNSAALALGARLICQLGQLGLQSSGIRDLRENKIPTMCYGYRLTHPTAGTLFNCKSLTAADILLETFNSGIDHLEAGKTMGNIGAWLKMTTKNIVQEKASKLEAGKLMGIIRAFIALNATTKKIVQEKDSKQDPPVGNNKDSAPQVTDQMHYIFKLDQLSKADLDQKIAEFLDLAQYGKELSNRIHATDHLINSHTDGVYTGSNNDMLNENHDNDALWGACGHDVLFGDAGDDQIMGLANDAFLYGGSGSDTLYSAWGRDELDVPQENLRQTRCDFEFLDSVKEKQNDLGDDDFGDVSKIAQEYCRLFKLPNPSEDEIQRLASILEFAQYDQKLSCLINEADHLIHYELNSSAAPTNRSSTNEPIDNLTACR